VEYSENVRQVYSPHDRGRYGRRRGRACPRAHPVWDANLSAGAAGAHNRRYKPPEERVDIPASALIDEATAALAQTQLARNAL
jgi:hypothetical protein